MVEPMLFYTAVPVLLGGRPREAGRLAAKLYARHGVQSHWYGRGWHPLLATYTVRHPVSLRFDEETDGIMTRLLCGFEAEQRYTGGIPCLIPCSLEAACFLDRNQTVLEERFVLLNLPEKGEDPLYRLVHSH